MNLISTSFLSAIFNLIKIIISFISNKVIALYIGPSGIALIGQLQNFINISINLSNGGINSGIIKYLSEYKNDIQKKNSYISTSCYITLFSSIIISILMLIFRNYLSFTLLKDYSLSYIFIIFSLSIIIFAFNNLLLNIINGLKDIKKLMKINILSNLTSFVFNITLVIKFNIYGALISLVTSQSLILFITISFVIKDDWFKLKNFISNYDKKIAANLFKFSIMSFISIISLNISQIIIRNFLINTISIESAGYWQSMIKLSDIYTSFILIILPVYYIPRFSELDNNLLLKKEIINAYKLLLPVLISMCSIIYLFREIIVKLVFSDSFLPMTNLFAFQVIGDFFKVSGILLSYLMIAKGMTKAFIYTEIIYNLNEVFLSLFLINKFGLIGMSYTNAINNFIYSILVIFIFRKIILFKLEQ